VHNVCCTLVTRPSSAAPARPALNLRIGDADRQPVTRQLAEALALGYLSMQEYEGRLDLALQAQRAGDLRELTNDLPGTGLPSALATTQLHGKAQRRAASASIWVSTSPPP